MIRDLDGEGVLIRDLLDPAKGGAWQHRDLTNKEDEVFADASDTFKEFANPDPDMRLVRPAARRRVAATPRVRRGYSLKGSRTAGCRHSSSALTWIVRLSPKDATRRPRRAPRTIHVAESSAN